MEPTIINLTQHIATIDIIEAIKTVFDPEIHLNIYDLGLIYKIEISDFQIDVLMTLTSANCPEALSIPEMVKNAILFKLNNNEILVNVDITFEPLWSTDNMSDEVLLRLGLL